jgi:outer membrane beta-barrel protein
VGAPGDKARAADGTGANTAEATTQSKAPERVINPRATATRKVRLSKKDNNVARSGPGDGFAIVGVYPKKATFVVIAKSGDWYDLRLSETETGWVHSSLCEEFDDMSDLQFQPNPRLYSRTGTFVLGGYGGAYAFDRKSNSLALGGRLGYYVFDRVQAEAGVAWTHVRRPAEIVESLFGLSLEAEDFHMLFYQLAVTYELLPGRQMVPYVTAGVGASIMQGDTETSWSLGAGTILFYSRRHCVRWEVRDYRFSSGTSASRVNNNNVEFTLGTSVLF